MHACVLFTKGRDGSRVHYGNGASSEASKVLPWNLGPLRWSGCCFHTWDARSFTAVAFAHFQTTLEKNTQRGFEEHGKECRLQIPLISFQIDVMKNQISMETWFKPLKESAANTHSTPHDRSVLRLLLIIIVVDCSVLLKHVCWKMKVYFLRPSEIILWERKRKCILNMCYNTIYPLPSTQACLYNCSGTLDR